MSACEICKENPGEITYSKILICPRCRNIFQYLYRNFKIKDYPFISSAMHFIYQTKLNDKDGFSAF